LSQALLLGRDHLKLGSIGAVSEGPAAIAISKGGAAKAYLHTDPNEDAAAFAIGMAGLFVAVADGHSGAAGAEIALRYLLAHCATSWTGSDCEPQDEPAWRDAILRAMVGINVEILKDAARVGVAPPGSTLSIAVARPRDNLLIHAAIGDSPLYEVSSRGGLAELGFEAQSDLRTRYLGHQTETEESLRDKCLVGSRPLDDVRAIVVASDGLTERGIGLVDPATAVVQIVKTSADGPADLRPLETARAVVEAALASHRENRAGDNAAAGVLWLEAPLYQSR
jgi:serine/threonine protein phosphatase PrpC